MQDKIQQLDPIVIRNIDRGMIDASAVSDSMMPTRQMRFIKNMDTEVVGSLKRRSGYLRLGSAQVIADNAILGLQHHTPTTANNNQIVAFVNQASDATAEAYYLAGTTWTNKALAFTASTKIRSVSFLGLLMAVNGTDSPKSWTGAVGDSWGTTSLVSAPTGSLIETFKQQVYIGNTTSDQINWSSIPTGGAITWTAADNFVVNPNDGSSLTALKRYGQELLIFKDDFLYRFNGQSTDADPLIAYGTPVQEAVVVTAGVCWFYDANKDGIYAYAGGYPQLVSKPVQSFIKAIPTSSRTSVCARGGNDFVEFFIGNVTIDGIAFTNVSLRYVVSAQTWVVRSYANTFKVFANYDDGTSIWNLGGTSEGSIVKMDTSNADLSTAIQYELETPWYVIGGNPTMEWTMAKFSAFVENSIGMNCFYKTDFDDTWRSIGSTKGYVTSFSGINAGFHKIKFRFLGMSSADPVIFEGFSILVPVLRGNEEESLRFV